MRFKKGNQESVGILFEYCNMDSSRSRVAIVYVCIYLFSYKLFGKRDKFQFYILLMPHLFSNIQYCFSLWMIAIQTLNKITKYSRKNKCRKKSKLFQRKPEFLNKYQCSKIRKLLSWLVSNKINLIYGNLWYLYHFIC